MELIRDNKLEDEQTYFKQKSTALQETSQNPSPPPPLTTATPSSATSSPTHEFSFTVSLHPLPPPTTTQHHYPNTYNTNNNHKTNPTTTLQPPPPPPPPEAIDLSPADDIFFHGHLLPLHPLPHLPDSPRSSTNSIDSFTLPINLLYHHSNPNGNTSFHCHHHTPFSDSDDADVITTTTTPNQPKSKSFSVFGIPKWPKRQENETERDENQTKDRNTKKLKLDLGQLIKRYMKMVKPLLSFPKSTRRANRSFNTHQSYSYSSNSLSRKQPVEMMSKGGRRRGQLSAPASMRASPANSGVLVTSGCMSPVKCTSESTMEELHAAIQAAIAHCKNSTCMDEENNNKSS